MYSTIYTWSIDHIKTVFEAKSEEECICALDDTFSHAIEVTVNGKTLSRMDLQRFVLSMLGSSGYHLSVQWQNAVEVPRDDSNRDGVLGGYYIIRNIRKPGSPNKFERHKFVNVVVESESVDERVDSRRIVSLSLTAVDKPMS